MCISILCCHQSLKLTISICHSSRRAHASACESLASIGRDRFVAGEPAAGGRFSVRPLPVSLVSSQRHTNLSGNSLRLGCARAKCSPKTFRNVLCRDKPLRAGFSLCGLTAWWHFCFFCQNPESSFPCTRKICNLVLTATCENWPCRATRVNGI